MASLTHSQGITEHVLAPGCEAMKLPFAPQHRITPTSVMAASFHSAFTQSTSPSVRIVPERHCSHLLSAKSYRVESLEAALPRTLGFNLQGKCFEAVGAGVEPLPIPQGDPSSVNELVRLRRVLITQGDRLLSDSKHPSALSGLYRQKRKAAASRDGYPKGHLIPIHGQ